MALSDRDLESVAEEMGLSIGRRKVLLAKLKAARDGVVAHSSCSTS